MTVSLSERALCVIASRLRAIRTDDGYSTNAGLNVLRARRKVNADECPAAVVWDLGETVNGESGASGNGAMNIVMSVNVEAHAAANAEDTGEVLERVKADVKRAVMSASMNGGIEDDAGQIGVLTYKGAACFAREDGATTESITVQFSISITERYGDPTRATR
jgi:hypothetical protein